MRIRWNGFENEREKSWPHKTGSGQRTLFFPVQNLTRFCFFSSIFRFSWCWMAYAIRETATPVSLCLNNDLLFLPISVRSSKQFWRAYPFVGHFPSARFHCWFNQISGCRHDMCPKVGAGHGRRTILLGCPKRVNVSHIHAASQSRNETDVNIHFHGRQTLIVADDCMMDTAHWPPPL